MAVLRNITCFLYSLPYIVFISTSGMLRSIYRYIYIICDPMHNRNNEFILIIYIVQSKMADFER